MTVIRKKNSETGAALAAGDKTTGASSGRSPSVFPVVGCIDSEFSD